MTISNTPWFQQLCKRAQLTGEHGNAQNMTDAASQKVRDDNLAEQARPLTDADRARTRRDIDQAKTIAEDLRELDKEIAPAPAVDDSVSSEVPQTDLAAAPAPDAPQQTDLAAAPAPDAPQQTVQAGIPSAALWAAGGVGAAGLLGYLLTRNRRRRDVA